MSTRILPPPARITRVFDDGDVPLSAKAIDEDWFLPQVTVAARINAQPLVVSDDFVQVTVVALDDSTWSFGAVSAASVKPQPVTDDEVGGTLANFVGDADGVALSYIQGLTYSQPFAFDEHLSFTISIVDEDGWLIGPAPAIAARAQPVTDDETSGVFRNFGLDDDLVIPLKPYLVAAVLRPAIFGDDDLPQFVVTIVDEDPFIIGGRPSAIFAQPFVDDEVSGVFKNFALDDDAPIGFQRLASLAPQTIWTDDEAFQLVSVSIVDEDGCILVSATLRAVFAQPSNVNDDVPPQLLVEDEPWFGLPQAKNAKAQQPQLDTDEWVLYVPPATQTGRFTVTLHGQRTIELHAPRTVTVH